MARKRTQQQSSWWEPIDVPPGQHLRCTIGTLALDIGHDHDEWTLASRSIEEDLAGKEPEFKLHKGPAEEVAERFVYAADSNRLQLSALLADRSVVIRPRQPLFLLSGQAVTLYLSTPIWLQVLVGDPPVLLKELPVLRLSDTWFGPNTREGELCYAGRTHARHQLDDLPERPHRAITPLTIHNKAASPLSLEKVSLPVPMLALYGDASGKLWTQAVTLTREGQTDLATVKIDSKLPHAGTELTRLAAPRQEQGRSGMTRAFSLLFGS